MTFLKLNILSVIYEMRRETIYAAKEVNINVEKGEILGLVGESGSGKSTVGNAIINLIDEPGKVSGGSIILDGTDIYEKPENILKLRGKKIGLIFQDPQTSLNPILTIGEQLIETIQTHLNLNTEDAKNKAIKWSPNVNYSPISIEELAQIMTEMVLLGEVKNQIYTICNNKVYTIHDIQIALEKALGKKLFRVPIPIAFLKILCKFHPNFLIVDWEPT